MKIETPLMWPATWPRSEGRTWAVFKVTRDSAVGDLRLELDRLGAEGALLSYNRSDSQDPGVALYFNLDGEQQCIPCDKWLTTTANIRAIGLTIAALRGLERWGAKSMVQAAFQGFKALPANVIVTPYTARPWHEVLEVSPTAGPDVVKAVYRRLAIMYHPDVVGGDQQKFEELQRAYHEWGEQSKL